MFTRQARIKLLYPCFRSSSITHLHQQSSFIVNRQQQKSHPSPEPLSSSTFPNLHVYSNIYHWSGLKQFADYLLSHQLYSDNDIVALVKPIGVGTHTRYDSSTHPDKIEPKMFGDPRYCIDDALELISNQLNVSDLSVCITQDRIVDGIIVLTKSPEALKKVKQLELASRRSHHPLYTFHCLTFGAPLMKEPLVEEKVAIQEICVNENTGDREPEIIHNLTKGQVSRREKIKRVSATLKVLDYNSNLNVALVEISCNRTNYHFIRCYLASKACFILGDPRFSRRVGHVLGVPYPLKAANKRPREEPLPNQIRKLLNVPKNRSIPFMLHQVKLSLKGYTKKAPLEIDNYTYPKHFIWTMNKLLTTKYQ